MNNDQLRTIYGGGFNLSVTFFNAISRYITTIKSVGESVGSSIRRILKKSYC